MIRSWISEGRRLVGWTHRHQVRFADFVRRAAVLLSVLVCARCIALVLSGGLGRVRRQWAMWEGWKSSWLKLMKLQVEVEVGGRESPRDVLSDLHFSLFRTLPQGKPLNQPSINLGQGPAGTKLSLTAERHCTTTSPRQIFHLLLSLRPSSSTSASDLHQYLRLHSTISSSYGDQCWKDSSPCMLTHGDRTSSGNKPCPPSRPYQAAALPREGCLKRSQSSALLGT